MSKQAGEGGEGGVQRERHSQRCDVSHIVGRKHALCFVRMSWFESVSRIAGWMMAGRCMRTRLYAAPMGCCFQGGVVVPHGQCVIARSLALGLRTDMTKTIVEYATKHATAVPLRRHAGCVGRHASAHSKPSMQ
eukprot:210030-Chlamydomonas_euryale.AAC.1